MLGQCRDELDIVYSSSPHALHAEQATAVAEAGLDLFLEKPMVTTVAEAETLIAAQKKSGVTIVTEPFKLDAISRKLAFFADPSGNLIELAEIVE